MNFNQMCAHLVHNIDQPYIAAQVLARFTLQAVNFATEEMSNTPWTVVAGFLGKDEQKSMIAHWRDVMNGKADIRPATLSCFEFETDTDDIQERKMIVMRRTFGGARFWATEVTFKYGFVLSRESGKVTDISFVDREVTTARARMNQALRTTSGVKMMDRQEFMLILKFFSPSPEVMLLHGKEMYDDIHDSEWKGVIMTPVHSNGRIIGTTVTFLHLSDDLDTNPHVWIGVREVHDSSLKEISYFFEGAVDYQDRPAALKLKAA